MRIDRFAFIVAFFVCVLGAESTFAQRELSVVREIQLKGTFETLVGDAMTIVDVDGKQHELRIQADPGKPISLSGGDVALNEPASILVTAQTTTDVLVPGMTVELQCDLGLGNRTGAVTTIQIMAMELQPHGIEVDVMPEGRDFVPATVRGVVTSVRSGRLMVELPDHPLAPRGRLTFELAGPGDVRYVTRSLAMLRRGDVIVQLDAADVSTGDTVIRNVQIELVGQRNDLHLTADEHLQLKYHSFSDEPGNPRELQSDHFVLTTDISDRQAKVLLEKLETMFQLVSEYYGARPRDAIEIYVVDDLGKWDTSDWNPRVVQKIRQGEGTTIWARQGRLQKTAVFSANNHEIVQHESLHGFCYLTFQGTGPLWYAEGMAEMGQYWLPDNPSVSANPAVIGYLRSRPPQPLMNIVEAKTIEGDTWKAYAWRWSLCHFLANNSNYSRAFKRLGVDLMREKNGVSFSNTYRRMADELTFEYQLFMKHLEAGLRVDLCAWQWEVSARVPGTSRPFQKKILAARGWQATGCLVEPDVRYHLSAEGSWSLSPGATSVDADGEAQGEGRLVGVIMKDYQLSSEFELGADLEFTVPSDGHLYVRCREKMSQIADNEGEVVIGIQRVK